LIAYQNAFFGGKTLRFLLYIANFLRRRGLSLRAKTRVASRTAGEITIVITKFFEELNKKMEARTYADIWNYDEVGIYFEPSTNFRGVF